MGCASAWYATAFHEPPRRGGLHHGQASPAEPRDADAVDHGRHDAGDVGAVPAVVAVVFGRCQEVGVVVDARLEIGVGTIDAAVDYGDQHVRGVAKTRALARLVDVDGSVGPLAREHRSACDMPACLQRGAEQLPAGA
jgi:hypothetical protein